MLGDLGSHAGVMPILHQVGNPAVQLTSFTGQQVAINSLAEQRMPQLMPSSAVRTPQQPSRAQIPERLSHLVIRPVTQPHNRRFIQRPSGNRQRRENVSSGIVHLRHPRQQQRAQTCGQDAGFAVRARGGNDLLGKKRIALRTGVSVVDQHRRRPRAEQQRDLLGGLLNRQWRQLQSPDSLISVEPL
jgi:hypothetical protein